MQKWNTLGLCVLLLAMLTACGQEKNMEQATQKDSPAADTEADTHRNTVPVCPVFLHWQTERRGWSLEKWETAIHACRMEAFFMMAAAVHRKMERAFISLRMTEQP